jgi:hypothetical protein
MKNNCTEGCVTLNMGEICLSVALVLLLVFRRTNFISDNSDAIFVVMEETFHCASASCHEGFLEAREPILGLYVGTGVEVRCTTVRDFRLPPR